MNTWLLIILLILIFSYGIETYISSLNINALDPVVPNEFKEVFDDKKYRESQLYTKTREKFSILSNSYSTLLTVIFLLSGGFNWLDGLVRSLDTGEIMSGLLFLSGLVILSFLANLPFGIYSTFVIEEKFGFNKTTVKTYILDIVKTTLLAALIGLPLLAALLWFFLYFGQWSWLYAWLLIVIFMVVMQFLAPTLIMPLFNKFTPLEEGTLKDAIHQYAGEQKFSVQGIYTMDGSKRSAKLNAFFTGFGRFKKIVFYDTLMEKLTNEQIIAVLAHEMGHFKLRHIHKMIFFSITQTAFMLFMLGQFLNYPEISTELGMETPSVYSGLLFFGLLFSPVSASLSLFSNIFSRQHEFGADHYAAESTGDSNALIAGLKELSKANLSNLTPHPWYVFLHYSHPPVIARIAKLRSIKRG